MAAKIKHPCRYRGCRALTTERYCEEHRGRGDKRESAGRRGYNRAWQQARLSYLSSHPLCVACEAEGRVRAAVVVDHVVPHRGNAELFWDESNWQALCKWHHDQKTGKGE
jgi:5-methylcytosine-specific restriction enzyme A